MNELTDSELLILGLVSEMPRHGYELEQIIEQRRMREWTQIAFSSIYFVLGKLEKKGFIQAGVPVSTKAKKKYKLSRAGKKKLVSQTLSALETVRPSHSSLLMGMLHLPVLTRDQTLNALQRRSDNVAEELDRLTALHYEQQPLPDHIDFMYEFSIAQLKTELQWVVNTLDYLRSKVWS